MSNRIQTLLAVATCALATLTFTGEAKAQHPNPESLRTWVDQGNYSKFKGNKIFVHASGPKSKDGTGVLIVHGFPGSSWDWKGVVAIVGKKTRVVVPDMIGFGHSDKPKTGTFKDNFSLMTQANMYEAIAREEGLTNVILVAHDMGQTVGAELMARHDEGKLSFKIKHAIIVNGSTLVDMVKLAPLQEELLKAPDKALTKHLDFKEFGDGLRISFSKEHAASQETIDCMTAQVFAHDGDLVIAQTMKYLDERREFYDRWVGTLTGFHSAPMSVYWGTQDPVALEAMADRIKSWRPVTDLHKWKDVGHWPSIEVPDRLAKAILDRLEG